MRVQHMLGGGGSMKEQSIKKNDLQQECMGRCLPLTIPAVPLKYSAIVACAAASFAAIQESHFIRTERE